MRRERDVEAEIDVSVGGEEGRQVIHQVHHALRGAR